MNKKKTKKQQMLENALKLAKQSSNTLEQPAIAPLDENTRKQMSLAVNVNYIKELKKIAFENEKTMSDILNLAIIEYIDTIQEEEEIKRTTTFQVSQKNIKKIKKFSLENKMTINKIVNIVIKKYLDENAK